MRICGHINAPMYDFQFETKIKDEDHFKAHDKYKYVEIECRRDGSDASFSQAEVSAEDICQWSEDEVFKEGPEEKSRLKIL